MGRFPTMPARDWFLPALDRGNPATTIDRRHEDGLAWTAGNSVRPLVHGDCYFRRLHEILSSTSAGDQVHLADWRGDRDERLAGSGTELGAVLSDLARRGVAVRGLVWRSHPASAKFSEEQ